MRGPGRSPTVLAGIAAAALLAGSTRTVWARASAPDLTGTAQQVEVIGADAAPAVLALAVVALAASLATALSSRWVRLVTAPVLIASGIGAAVAAVLVVIDPAASSGSAVAQATGVVGGQISAEATSWPLLALVPSLLVTAIGVCVLVVGGRWGTGSRYRSAAVTTAADPGDDPAAAWDALTRGEDPTADDMTE